jgi:hypothetical protein
VVEEPKLSRELIQSVFELYAPNKFQKFMIKRFGFNAWFSGNKKRVETLQSILHMSQTDVIHYEMEFYLGWEVKRANG